MTEDPDQGSRPRASVTGRHRYSTASPSTFTRVSCSVCSARMAPARPRRSRSCRVCDAATAARSRCSDSTRRSPATVFGDGSAAQLQDAALPDRMRVGEALKLFASLHPEPRPLDELADEWQLDALWKRPFEALSGGERQRLFVALALVGRPRLVFLDELTQNLDPVGRRQTWDVVRRIRDGGTTVVLVTHDVEEAERLCDRIVVLDGGRVVAEGTPAAIVNDLGGEASVVFTDRDVDVRDLRNIRGVHSAERHGAEVQDHRHRAGAGTRRRPPRRRRPSSIRSSGRTPDARGPLRRTHQRQPTGATRMSSTTTVDVQPAHIAVDGSARAVRSRTLRSAIRLVAVELRLILREPMVAVGLIGFPLVTVLVLAGVFGQGPDPDFGGVAPSDHYLAGYIGVVLASLGLITIPVHLATQRELGVLRRFRASGVSAGVLVARELVLGIVLGTVASAGRARRRRRGLRARDARRSPRSARLVPRRPCLLHRDRGRPRLVDAEQLDRRPLWATSSSFRCSCSAEVAHREPS